MGIEVHNKQNWKTGWIKGTGCLSVVSCFQQIVSSLLSIWFSSQSCSSCTHPIDNPTHVTVPSKAYQQLGCCSKQCGVLASSRHSAPSTISPTKPKSWPSCMCIYIKLSYAYIKFCIYIDACINLQIYTCMHAHACIIHIFYRGGDSAGLLFLYFMHSRLIYLYYSDDIPYICTAVHPWICPTAWSITFPFSCMQGYEYSKLCSRKCYLASP